jgi:nicotinamidase-related amidase
MTTATPAPGKLLLSPFDHTLILIDFQSQMAFATRSIDPVVLRNNAGLVANAARIFNVALSALSSSFHPSARPSKAR